MTPLMAAKHIGEGDAALLIEALLAGTPPRRPQSHGPRVCAVRPTCHVSPHLSLSHAWMWRARTGQSGDDIGKSNDDDDDDDAELAKAKAAAGEKAAGEKVAALADSVAELEVVDNAADRQDAYPADQAQAAAVA